MPREGLGKKGPEEMKSAKTTVMAALVVVGALGAPAMAQPDLGAPPLYSEMDYFTADDWGMTVYSYVFDYTAPPPVEFGQALDPQR